LIDVLRLALLLRRLEPDVTLSYFVKPVIYGSIASWMGGVPNRFALVEGLGYVFALAGRQEETLKRRSLRYLVTLLYWIAFSGCSRVFFVNDDDPEYFISRGLLDRSKVVRVRGAGIDLESLVPSQPVKSPVTFLLMARLLREKGICEYVEAARMVRAKHPACRFLMLGGFDPNPGGLTRQEVAAWLDEGVVEWPGHVDDVKPWIANCSVYVLPSYYREGLPQSTQEAMAMGRAVITTDNVGCRETVEHGVNGFLVPVRDAPSLARAMERFIEHPELIETMGRASRRLAEQRFDVRQVTNQMLRTMKIVS
jgi:glycosyltransferase involved in cell wall biosynthesis